MIVKKLLTLLLLITLTSLGFAQDQAIGEAPLAKDYSIRGVAELGFLAVMAHKVQFSNNGTYFDYVKDGGQDVLFPISRLSLELDFKKRNTFILLLQPLRLESTVLLENDLTVDSLTFPANSSVDLLYNFPFFRLSYLRELVPNNEKFDLAIGGTIQIRNATISFESTDGSRFRSNRDIGIVPAFKVRSTYHFSDKVYTQLEADGIYAPVSYINGSDNEVVGAILDASLRQGIQVSDPIKAFLNVRYLGGGAVGTSDDDPGPGDGYVRNWLNFLTVTTGFVYEL